MKYVKYIILALIFVALFSFINIFDKPNNNKKDDNKLDYSNIVINSDEPVEYFWINSGYSFEFVNNGSHFDSDIYGCPTYQLATLDLIGNLDNQHYGLFLFNEEKTFWYCALAYYQDGDIRNAEIVETYFYVEVNSGNDFLTISTDKACYIGDNYYLFELPYGKYNVSPSALTQDMFIKDK